VTLNRGWIDDSEVVPAIVVTGAVIELMTDSDDVLAGATPVDAVALTRKLMFPIDFVCRGFDRIEFVVFASHDDPFVRKR
jgi:hypothetical protein